MCYCNLTEKLVHFAKHSYKNVTRLTCQLTHSEYNSLYSIQTNKKPVWFFSEKMKREKKRQKSYSEYALHIFREFQSPSPKWSRKQESHSELVVFVCRETEEMLNWMLKLTERLNKWWIPRNDNKILQEMTKRKHNRYVDLHSKSSKHVNRLTKFNLTCGIFMKYMRQNKYGKQFSTPNWNKLIAVSLQLKCKICLRW